MSGCVLIRIFSVLFSCPFLISFSPILTFLFLFSSFNLIFTLLDFSSSLYSFFFLEKLVKSSALKRWWLHFLKCLKQVLWTWGWCHYWNQIKSSKNNSTLLYTFKDQEIGSLLLFFVVINCLSLRSRLFWIFLKKALTSTSEYRVPPTLALEFVYYGSRFRIFITLVFK